MHSKARLVCQFLSGGALERGYIHINFHHFLCRLKFANFINEKGSAFLLSPIKYLL